MPFTKLKGQARFAKTLCCGGMPPLWKSNPYTDFEICVTLQPVNAFTTMIITIARQCGCGALNIGKGLSERFGIPFYTRHDLLEMARKRCDCIKELEDFFEERPVDELIFAISSFETYDDADPSHKSLHLLQDMIGTSNCIIIGRCGNHIFRHREDLVSVFLKGSIGARVSAVAKERHLSRGDAEEYVSNLDDSRVRYHKYYTGLTWGNADDYDLCIDSIRLGTDKSVELIAKYIEYVKD